MMQPPVPRKFQGQCHCEFIDTGFLLIPTLADPFPERDQKVHYPAADPLNSCTVRLQIQCILNTGQDAGKIPGRVFAEQLRSLALIRILIDSRGLLLPPSLVICDQPVADVQRGRPELIVSPKLLRRLALDKVHQLLRIALMNLIPHNQSGASDLIEEAARRLFCLPG